MKFELLSGKHQTPDPSRPANPETPHILGGTITYVVGNIIETNQDLARMFNSRGSTRFRKVAENTPVSGGFESVHDLPSPDEKMETMRQEQQGELEDAFEGKTVPQLKLLAQDNGIDLKGATKKAGIIAVLREEFNVSSDELEGVVSL